VLSGIFRSENVCPGLAILEDNLVADNRELEGVEPLFGLAQHLQPHRCAALAPDELDDVVEAHVNDALKDVVRLRDGDDAVIPLELAVPCGGTSGNDGVDDGVAILPAQHCANAFERKLDGDVEVFEVLRCEVRRMRVVGSGHGVEEDRQRVVIGVLRVVLPLPPDALEQSLLGLVQRRAAQRQGQQVELHFQPPRLTGGFRGFGIGRLFAINLPLGVLGEIELLLQNLLKHRQSLRKPGLEAGEHIQRKIRIPPAQQVVHLQLVALEALDVGLQKVVMSGVEPTEVVGEDCLGEGIVQRLLRVVEGGEALNDSAQDRAVEPVFRLGGQGQKLDRQAAGEN